MATNGSKTVNIFSWISMTFKWEQVSQSIENNTTSIKWSLSATTNGGALYISNRTWVVNIDGTKYTGTVNINLNSSSTQTLASGTATIKHNDNGTKTFTYSFSQQFELTLNSGKYMGTYSGNGSDTLTTIPRKSSMAVANGTLGSYQEFTVKKASDSFTHTIEYKCGNAPVVKLYEKISDTTVGWFPPLDLATQAPQGNSVVVNFTITTYSGGTAIGTDTAQATYSIPASVYPPVALTVTDPTGYAEYYGAYIQGKSKIKIEIDTYGAYGSWIKSYRTTFDGKTYTEQVVNSDVIIGKGTLPISVTVTDSRERSTTDNTSIEVLEYKAPKINNLSAYRSDGNGNANPNGDHITVKFSSEIYALNNKNGAWYKVTHRLANATEETTVDLVQYTGQYSVTDGTYTFPADSSSVSVLLKVGDRFSTTPTSVVAPSVKKVFSWLKKAGEIVGMAWGKLAELEGVFDIGYQTRLTGGLLHSVLPTNSDLNAELTPKTYMLLSANTYLNTPESGKGAFLEIVGIKDGSLIQRYSIFDNVNPREYERIHYSTTGWGEWICVRGDFVIEQGEKDGWTYRKWNSGVGECWKTLSYTTTVTGTWGAMYISGNTDRQNYPFVFTSKPVENVSVVAGDNSGWICPQSAPNGGTNGAYASAVYHIVRPTALSDYNTYYINYQVKGKWK